MKIRGNRFLVIGGAGFIGSHVVDQLVEAGAAHVRVYDNFSRGSVRNLAKVLQNSMVEVFPDGGDILHRDILLRAMDGMDGVFHLAALWLLQCYEYPRSAFDVNVAGTMNILEAITQGGVKRLVFSSSGSVYGDATGSRLSEGDGLNCKEFYGASKVCGEMLLRAVYHQQRMKHNHGFGYAGLRYMNVYGLRQHDTGPYIGVVARMINALAAGEQPVIYGDGTQSYDFIDVRDCARANLLAMESDLSDRFYNIGTGVETSIAELALQITRVHGRGITPRFESTHRPFVSRRVGEPMFAKNELKFDSKIALSEGLRELIHSNIQSYTDCR